MTTQRAELGWSRSHWLLNMAAPVAVVVLYRMVPAPVRGFVCARFLRRPLSTSAKALGEVRQGLGWHAVFTGIQDWLNWEYSRPQR